MLNALLKKWNKNHGVGMLVLKKYNLPVEYDSTRERREKKKEKQNKIFRINKKSFNFV